MSDVEVRPAGPDDAAAIAAIHVRTWQVAYRDLMPQDFLDGLDPERRAEGWTRTLSQPREREATLVALAAGQVIGFANAGASRDDDAAEGDGELRAVYVDPEHWNCGAGRALMTAVLETLRHAGFDDAILWVLVGNERARRFYEAAGWVADGATKHEDSFGVVVTELRYRRPLR